MGRGRLAQACLSTEPRSGPARARASGHASPGINFDVAPRNGTVHCPHGGKQGLLDSRPTRRAQNHDGDDSIDQVLLVPEILVRRDEDLETRGFGSQNQLTVLEAGPSALVSCLYRVPDEMPSKWRGRALVEQNLHLGHGQRTACSVLQNDTCLLQRDPWKPVDELVDRGTVLEILEECSDRNACPAKNPGPAHAIGVALGSGAGRPINHEEMVAPGSSARPSAHRLPIKAQGDALGVSDHDAGLPPSSSNAVNHSRTSNSSWK